MTLGMAAPVFRELERVEHRVLGALRCVDATTGAPLSRAMHVKAPADADVRPNRSGLLVILGWAPLASHAAAFDAPPDDEPGSGGELELTLVDPLGHYLPHRVRVALPRQANAVFEPLHVPMYPSPAAALSLHWAALRVGLTTPGGAEALGGVLVRVLRDGAVLARGLSDWRGEALVPVAGIPVTTWSTEPGAVVVSEIGVTVEAIADPASTTRTPMARVRAGQSPVTPPVSNPTAIESARAVLPQASVSVSLAAGRPLHLSLGIALP